MISEQDISNLIGNDVVDSDGDKIGSVGQVYVDPSTGRPNWVTVKTGLFGMSESFVPLDAADTSGNELRVPYSKQMVKDAPNIDPDSELSDAEADRLYEYYQGAGSGYGYGGTTGTTDVDTDRGYGTGDRDYTDVDTGRDRPNTTQGYDTSGPTTDDAMTRSEERLHVGTEKVQTGRARLRKYVVTENQQVNVPVSREEVRLEREPITDGNVGDALSGPDISEEEHEVILTEERPVVEKETVPVERVRLGTETVTDTERVDADLRKEEIELEDAGSTTRTDRDRI
jgi:uncharacterized protein (TIGR02271 family)